MTGYLCSFHVPKTGGTTFAFHARTSLPAGKFLQHGPFARVERFFAGQPQAEEMSERELAAVTVAHGHGADISLAEALRGRQPEFMVILRDPYARFVSGFNHANSVRRNSALSELPEESYLNSRGGNMYAKLLLSQFSPLAGPGKGVTLERLMPILKSFKYLLLTEHMDRQIPELSALYGLKQGQAEARRVNRDKKSVKTDRAEFAERNAVDIAVFEQLDEAAQRPGTSLGNPFGHDPSALHDYLENVWRQRTDEERLAIAYDDLVVACRKAGRLQAAHLKLVHGKSSHVREPDLLRRRIEEGLDTWLDGLSAEELSLAHFWSGMMFMNEANRSIAEDYFREAVRLNPDNDNALGRLARTLRTRGLSRFFVRAKRAWRREST